MKFNKKSKIIGTFALGAVILAASGFADIALGSGYHNLKSSIKTTTAKLTEEVDNFNVDIIGTFKVDGEIVAESTGNTKFDLKNQAQVTTGTELNRGETRESYWYNDNKQVIYKNSEDGSYEVTEKQKSNSDRKIIENPFKDEQVKDAEKIMDALVGSLEDVIQVEESDNKIMYVGNIGDTEIPPLVNAVTSFMLKYSIFDDYTVERLEVPSPKSNIYVKEASGKAIENEDGILESGIFTASMSGEDSKGIEHTYTIEFSIDIKDINNTVVKAPNLDGQEVTYSKEGFEFDQKYIGKYKNDIVEVENNSFIKLGERVIEITSIEDGNIKGRYYEVYNEGHEPEETRSFKFSSDYDESNYETKINYVDNNGQNKQGVIYQANLQDIHLALDVTFNDDGGYSYEGVGTNFIRIFE